MLFTTGTFLLLYLPVVMIVFYLVGSRSTSGAVLWLFLASLFFYAWWMPEMTLLLVASMVSNFQVGQWISRFLKSGNLKSARAALVTGLAGNLALLAYFKYADFLVANFNAASGSNWDIGKIILPIGISFYTFTQIAFLVDSYQGKVNEPRFFHYGLFVTYFPHLVAGPVLHHAQMMPQFADPAVCKPVLNRIVAGLAIFGLGLFKKVVLADGIAPYADAVFNPADAGRAPTMAEAWIGALAYTLQLYFDFSGYSDMAIGLSYLFNVRLPFNFNSPYRALNISDFWRRWHISLSTFLRDYLYIPLGGNRHGPARRYLNLLATMLLGGLWHGAGWTFVLWGGLHGLYLMVHHGWHALWGEEVLARWNNLGYRAFAWVITMLAVVVAWIFFRATTFEGALRIVTSMFCGSPDADGVHALMWDAGLQITTALGWCGALTLVALAPMNSNVIGKILLERLQALDRHHFMLGIHAGAVLTGIGMLLLVNSLRESVSAFIYFNF